MGKRTFEEIQEVENIGDFYPTTQNYVFTHSGDFYQNGFITIDTDVVEFVKQIDKGKISGLSAGTQY